MTGIIRVNEGVGSCTISTVGDNGSTGSLSRTSWLITSCILVVSKVSVCGVVGVDEGVPVGWDLCGLDIVVVLVVVVVLLLRLRLLIRLLWLSLLLVVIRFTVVGVMSSRVLSIGTIW